MNGAQSRLIGFVRFTAALMLVGIGIAAGPLSHAAAQSSGLVDDSTYRFGIDGTEITWGGQWEFDPSASGEFEGYETATLLSPSAGLFIGQVEAGIPLDLDAFLAVVVDTTA